MEHQKLDEGSGSFRPASRDGRDRRARVALVSFYNTRSYPVHLLHAVLEEHGHEVHSFFFKETYAFFRPLPEEIDALVNEIAQRSPDLVGISVMSTYFNLAAQITEQLKKRCDTLVIWGGIHPTISPDDCLRHADIVCRGEGELPLLELADAIAHGGEFTGIENLWVKQDGQVIRNGIRHLLSNLDVLPYPDFTSPRKWLFGFAGAYPFAEANDKARSYDLMTSRGCPFSCSYCANDKLKEIYQGKGKVIRRRSVAHVLGEIKHAQQQFRNVREIGFSDDVFMFDSAWLRKFCTEYGKHIGLPFFCYSHPSVVRDDLIRLLKRSGLRYTTMGIQAGSLRIRQEYFGRNTPNEKILSSAAILRKNRVKCAYDFISDNPFETEGDKYETLNLVSRLPRPFQMHLYSLTFFPKTVLTDKALKAGKITSDDVETRSEKGYAVWGGSLLLKRDDDGLLWDLLYFLARMRLPRWVLFWLSRKDWFRKRARTIARLLRLLPLDYYFYATFSVDSRINMFIHSKVRALRHRLAKYESHRRMKRWGSTDPIEEPARPGRLSETGGT